MHIVHYTSAHPWTSSRIFSKMCAHLVGLGHQVSMVAVDPTATTKRSFTESGVQVHLLPPARRRGRVSRALLSGAQVTRYAFALQPDVLHFHDPELIAHSFRRRPPGAKLVFDAHEDFVAQTDGKEWAAGPQRRFIRGAATLLRKAISLRADRVVAATDGVGSDYPQEKMTVIRNVPIGAEFPAGRERRALIERSRDICYVGSLSKIRGVIEMIEAAQLCASVDTLHLAGNFEPPGLEAELRQLPGWKKVEYHGYINREQIAALLDRVRVGLLLLHPLPNYVDSLPIKLLEYRAAGVPILASDFSYWHQFIRTGEAGEFVDPTDLASIATMLEKMMLDASASGYEDSYTQGSDPIPAWEDEVRSLHEMYLSIS